MSGARATLRMQAVTSEPAETLRPERFQQGNEDPMVARVAFALAAEAGGALTPDAVERLRHDANAALSAYSFRYLHNAAEEIRRDAVAAHLRGTRRPPSFGRLVFANLLAIGLAGGAYAWATRNPERIEAGLAAVRNALAGAFGG